MENPRRRPVARTASVSFTETIEMVDVPVLTPRAAPALKLVGDDDLHRPAPSSRSAVVEPVVEETVAAEPLPSSRLRRMSPPKRRWRATISSSAT